jgi:hypothetical protein
VRLIEAGLRRGAAIAPTKYRRTERDEMMNMVFGAANDGEWLTREEWDDLYAGQE